MRKLSVLLTVVALVVAACEDSADTTTTGTVPPETTVAVTTTEPIPTTAPVAPPTAVLPPAPQNLLVGIYNSDLNGNTFGFTWDAGQTPAFLVEIGHQPGGSDVAVIEVDQPFLTVAINEVDQPFLTWDPPARGVGVDLVDYFVRVRGKNDVGIGPPSNLYCPGTPPAHGCYVGKVQDLDLRAFIEAQFLGDGPLSVGPPSGFMGGFPFGSQVTVRFLNTVDPEWREVVRDLTGGCNEEFDFANEAIPCAMGLTFTYSETSDRERMEDAIQGGPRPPQNEVWVYNTDGACTGDVPTHHHFRGRDSFTHKYFEAGSPVTWAAIICLPSSTDQYEAAHEMGHALGFQDLVRGLRIYGTMMRPDSFHCSLSEYEFAATELAYAAGLRPGDTRQDFINAGLIEP